MFPMCLFVPAPRPQRTSFGEIEVVIWPSTWVVAGRGWIGGGCATGCDAGGAT